MRFLFFPAAIVVLVSQLAVLASVVAGRAPASSRRPSARWVEIGWVVLPTVVLIAVLYATWGAIEHVALVRNVLGIPA